MELTMNMSLRQALGLSQRQLLENRLAQSLLLRTNLLDAVRGEKYSPKAVCPECTHGLSATDIIKGFRNDPADITTCCPKCQHRFTAKLVCDVLGGRIEVPFYCKRQTLAALPATSVTPENISRSEPAVYRSAIFHFGSLQKAYAEAGMDYPHVDKATDWADKVMNFLGMVPDGMIASVAGVSVYRVKRLRRMLGFSGFRGYSSEQPKESSIDFDDETGDAE